MVDDVAHTERDEKAGDGTALVFRLTSSPAVTATVTVAINNVTQSTGFTTDLPDGLVTFTSAPSSAQTVAVTYDAALFTDAEVQSAIDTNLVEVWLEPMTGLPTAGALTYTKAVSQFRNFIENPTITNEFDVAQTVTTYNNDEGHYTMASGTAQQLYLTGQACDINAAAADLMMQKAARYVTSVNVNLDGQQMSRSDIFKAAESLAKHYRSKAWGRSVTMQHGSARTAAQSKRWE
jgi:hypothetical protein